MTDPTWTTRPAPPIDPLPTDPDAVDRAIAAVRDRVREQPDLQATSEQVARTLAGLAVPPGSLGSLEGLVHTLPVSSPAAPAAPAAPAGPAVPVRPAVIVLAADHGIHATGVSPWPQTIGSVVARLAAQGTAAVNALAGPATRLVVVDVGLRQPPPPHPRLLHLPVRPGTRNPLTRAEMGTGPEARLRPELLARPGALTRREVHAAILRGIVVADALIAAGADLLALGDIGIANTTTSAALVSSAIDGSPAALTGRGSGIDDATLARKQRLVAALHARAVGRTALDRLAILGGLEHAAGVGVLLAARARDVPVVLDGVVSVATALHAVAIEPRCRDRLIAGHRSPEPAAGAGLDALGLEAVLDLRLRIGEGTGAALAIPIVQAAARLLHTTASLAHAQAEVAALDATRGDVPPDGVEPDGAEPGDVKPHGAEPGDVKPDTAEPGDGDQGGINPGDGEPTTQTVAPPQLTRAAPREDTAPDAPPRRALNRSSVGVDDGRAAGPPGTGDRVADLGRPGTPQRHDHRHG